MDSKFPVNIFDVIVISVMPACVDEIEYLQDIFFPDTIALQLSPQVRDSVDVEVTLVGE